MSDSAIGVENIITVRMNARTDLAALYTWNTESVARVIQAIWAKELRPTLQQSSIARVGVICALRDGGCAVAPHDPLWILQGAWTLPMLATFCVRRWTPRPLSGACGKRVACACWTSENLQGRGESNNATMTEGYWETIWQGLGAWKTQKECIF